MTVEPQLQPSANIEKDWLTESDGETDYFIGSRGNRTSKFDVYLFNNKENQNVKIYTYNGQEELDYSIFTKNAIFVFEAKSLINGGLDVGWHKLAYPLTRFKRFNVPKFPCYFLKKDKVVWLFVFPEYNFSTMKE